MSSRHGTPVAYFDMNAMHGVPLNRVHNMITDVGQRVGRSRCHIDITETQEDGRYFITFYEPEAADLFERLYRQTGQTPRRLDRLPDDVAIINMDEAIVGFMVLNGAEFIRRMRANLN